MAEFRTAKEQKKWQALEASAQGSLNRVLAGKGTQADFHKVSDVLKKYDQLAARIFQQGLSEMEEATNKLLKRITEDRETKGKEPLTEEQVTKLFDLAFDRQLKDFGPDLVETIDSMLDRKFEASEERTEKNFSSHFSRIASLVKTPEEQREILADLFTPKEQDEKEAEQQVFLDKVGNVVKEALRETLKDILNADKHQGVPDKQRSSPFSLIRSLVGRTRDKISGAAKTVGGGLSAGVTKLLSSLSPRAEAAVVENSQKQASFTQLLSDKLNGIFDWVKKRASSQSEREDRQENRWLRKLKLGGFFKGVLGKAKDIGSKAKGWLPLIGKGLATALLAPGLIKSITTTLGEWFTWENIKTTLGKWWDDIESTGSTVLNWVTDKVSKIDYKGIAKSIWESFVGLFTPKKEEPKTPAAKAVQKAEQANPGGTFMMGEGGISPDMVAAYDPTLTPDSTQPVKGQKPQDILKAGPTKPLGGSAPATGSVAASGAPIPTLPTPTPMTDTKNKYGFTVPAGNNRSTISPTLNQNNAFNFTTGDRTRSQAFNNVKFKPGTAVEDPLTKMAKEANKQREQDKGFHQNRTTIGLGSVPLLSGVSPTLGLINLGVAG